MRRMTVLLVAAVALSGAIGVAAFAQAQRAMENVKVLSGAEIGFRVERLEAGRAVGTFVVKVDGQWVEAVPTSKAMAVR